MKLNHLIAGSAALFPAAFCFGGQETPQPTKGTPSVIDNRPVTQNEAKEVFAETRQALSRALELTIPAGSQIPTGTTPVTREMVVAELAQEYNLLRPKAKFTPMPVSYQSSVLKIRNAERSNLERLVRLGLVAKVGPLATGPTDTINPRDLGDAVGFFICRMAQITHLPDPKWSPMIENPND